MKKLVCIVVLFVVILLIFICCDPFLAEPADSNTDVAEANSMDNAENAKQEKISEKEKVIDEIVKEYNLSSTKQMTFIEAFSPPDKENGHYRVEFRLTAYRDAIGKSYKIEEQQVDIISSESIFGDISIRLYADNATLDQCVEIIKFVSPLLDSTLSEDELEETVEYVTDKNEANGYYYGELGLVLSGNDETGYDLMIKTD